ncbi:MAG: 3-oxoacyl-ACP synthase III [Planctomycetes bacterium]|nr:3-oxoacyl-ACP synthase III [Planctomycetota bacterium]MBU4397807.1 3-oxoacyl-ACP synthase III [Planctomycetota bacterium]MCG2684555.1 3-oxoacyl-ACP synthase III [Planctomycetales bacterium]
MRYENVCLETISHSLPEQIVTSAEIESRLAPLYARLRLPEGRLELMTGIAERRFWPLGDPPSRMSVETAEKAIRISGIDRQQIGALLHGSVCRDFLEPATACGVHHRLGLPDRCAVYDVSNACLGLLNGVVQVANMIELGQIRAGVVVGTENGRDLVEATIAHLNADETLSRQDVKAAFASLTIGSGSAAILLCDRKLSRTGNRLLGGAMRTSSEHCRLCQGGRDETSGAQLQLLMWTDSEKLMREGVAVARDTFDEFLAEMDWTAGDIQKTFCHQVGRAHRRLLFETLGLDERIDYSTVEYLGNTGAAALPMTTAIGIENGRLHQNDRVALLGIGSGINVIMLGVEWQRSLVD